MANYNWTMFPAHRMAVFISELTAVETTYTRGVARSIQTKIYSGKLEVDIKVYPLVIDGDHKNK